MQTKIKPELIATGTPQVITADLKPFDKAKEQVTLTILELNRSLPVETETDKIDALEVLGIASKVEKAIENKRKELVKPFNDGATAINTHAKEITEGLPKAILTVKNAVIKFQKEEEERALELKKQARVKQLREIGFTGDFAWDDYMIKKGITVTADSLLCSDSNWVELVRSKLSQIKEVEEEEIQALQEEDPELAELLGFDDESPEPVIVAPAPSTAYFAPSALKGASKVWKFEITDATLVPREFLVVDEVAVRKAVMAGTREIPGVRIYQEDKLSIRN